MSKRCAFEQRVALAVGALLVAGLLAAAPARAADAAGDSTAVAPAKPAAAAPAGKGVHVKKEKQVRPSKKSAAKAAAKPVAKAAKPPKAPKTPKPPAPPEASYEEQKKEDGLWTKRTSWIGLRAGYAKSSADGAGDGLVGYGLAYQRMISNRWAFGASVQHDLLGHIGASTEISVPFTVELTRHFRMDSSFRPYLGFGGGYYFHKYYRTGGDTGSPGTGGYVNFGANVPIDDKRLLGVDVRLSSVSAHEATTNPVFGPEPGSETLWSIKLSYSLAYH